MPAPCADADILPVGRLMPVGEGTGTRPLVDNVLGTSK